MTESVPPEDPRDALIRERRRRCQQGLPVIPAPSPGTARAKPRRAVAVGLAQSSRVPGPKNTVRQKPGREMLECHDRRGDVLCFTTDTSVWPTNNLSAAQRPDAEDPAGDLRPAHVTQDKPDIRRYIDTARNAPRDHGRDAHEITSWQPLVGR